jgi:molybdate-binding protein
MEAAARSFGLGFEPLEEHTVEVWLDERWASLPAASALIESLSGVAFQSRLAVVGGYDLTSCANRVA